MKETPNHGIRYPEKADPDALQSYWENQALDTERELDNIKPSQIVGGADGQLIIVKDGAPAFAAMKGDATITEDGTLAIGDGRVSTKHLADGLLTTAKYGDKSVTEAKLVDGSATSRKLKPTSGRVQAAEAVLGEAISEVAQLKLTPAVDSRLVVWADGVFDVKADSTVRVSVKWGVNLRAWQKQKHPVGERGFNRTMETGVLKAGEEIIVALIMSRLGAGNVTLKSGEEWQSGFTYMLLAA